MTPLSHCWEFLEQLTEARAEVEALKTRQAAFGELLAAAERVQFVVAYMPADEQSMEKFRAAILKAKEATE